MDSIAEAADISLRAASAAAQCAEHLMAWDYTGRSEDLTRALHAAQEWRRLDEALIGDYLDRQVPA